MMNVIKMDLYRMVKQKISYILLVALTAFLVFSVAMTAFLVFSVAMTKEDMAMTQTPMTAEQASEESMGNLGLYLNVPGSIGAGCDGGSGSVRPYGQPGAGHIYSYFRSNFSDCRICRPDILKILQDRLKKDSG